MNTPYYVIRCKLHQEKINARYNRRKALMYGLRIISNDNPDESFRLMVQFTRMELGNRSVINHLRTVLRGIETNQLS